MLESYLIKGILVGLVFGVPAGAIGALTIQRTLAHGFIAGFSTGAGSSLADILYGCVGVFGLTIVSDFLLEHQKPISLVGGGFIILLGICIFKKKATEATNIETGGSLLTFFLTSFAIAMANPATILAFFVAFSSFGIAEKPTAVQGAQLILGILLGTLCWWGMLSGAVSVFKKHITNKVYKQLNYILGGLLMIFGTAVAIRTI